VEGSSRSSTGGNRYAEGAYRVVDRRRTGAPGHGARMRLQPLADAAPAATLALVLPQQALQAAAGTPAAPWPPARWWTCASGRGPGVAPASRSAPSSWRCATTACASCARGAWRPRSEGRGRGRPGLLAAARAAARAAGGGCSGAARAALGRPGCAAALPGGRTSPTPRARRRRCSIAALVRAALERQRRRAWRSWRAQGLDLARFGQRYSHAGLSLRESAASPAVRQLYYACDERRSRVFDQGMAAFVLGTDDPAQGFVSVVLPGPQAAHALARAALDDALALRLLGAAYSANAHAFASRYQNCNQWVAEMLAAAWGGVAAPGQAAGAARPAAQGLAARAGPAAGRLRRRPAAAARAVAVHPLGTRGRSPRGGPAGCALPCS
jgi:hypothetical protein